MLMSIDTSKERPPVRSLLIVARGQSALFEALWRDLADNPFIEVILDRRYWDRRQRDVYVAEDRRGKDRRISPSGEDDLSRRQYLLARPLHRRPSQ